MYNATSNSSIPALQSTDGSWARSSLDKATLLAETFQSKWFLPSARVNEFTDIFEVEVQSDSFIPLRTREGSYFLEHLDLASATGPDNIGTKILKRLTGVLAIPFTKLARRIVRLGIWPNLWKIHWIYAIYKKKSVYDPANYRGI